MKINFVQARRAPNPVFMASLLRACVPSAAIAAFAPHVATLHAQTVTVGDTREGSGGAAVYHLTGYETFAFGQTFRTPDAISTSLISWSVWLNVLDASRRDDDNRFPVPVTLQIFDWSASRELSSLIFKSDPVTPTDPTPEGTRTTFDIGIDLDPARLFAAFIVPEDRRSAQFASTHIVGLDLVYIAGTSPYRDQYTDGQLWGMEILENGQLIRLPYDNFDMRFEAQFDAPVTVTPEPASMTLMATGMAGIAWFARRRRKKAAGAR